MSKLETFKLPDQDTRLIRCNNTVYKFKLQYRDGSNRLPCDVATMQQEMEHVVRCLLQIKESLHPVRTDHFVIYPYKRPWGTARKLKFYQGQRELQAYPYVLYVYVEPTCKIAQVQRSSPDPICPAVDDDIHGTSAVADDDKLEGVDEGSETHKRDKPRLTQANINEVLNTEYGHLFIPPPPKKVKRKHIRQTERSVRTQEHEAVDQSKELPVTQADETPPGPSSAPAPSTSRKAYRLGRRHRSVDTPISGRPRKIHLHSRPDRHAIESFQLAEQQRLQQLACPTSTRSTACDPEQDTQPAHAQEMSVVGSFLRMLINPARQLFRGHDTS
ncbi:PREDICTED: uncharacterized protein LOC109471158 [Branchiostoma belcheri]|uniref:Uncharacterized protein LOC109471158 n=1 Tax=Branchiostoma belcheri TaxID=7741 RepID=A0A6P4YW69_BRABE|nr:PREDICTED: uncharacterized protein LOC109471158 [Branchiostoma belcheri]XP_019625988.1 PREDICTED: uncharacterized protein LOC109471158 [Branchiostoma belcheri]XP_019625989.1 PREDICTED: uncharacterized protein LOC109471158 [Branchiostoma belcheri]XP_019625990.1 PREDICTED: uncharacterized protein LOC109471158 [Branchiostoma belcheri]XP_019625991.1 PREDICTED: uncharacterized protein LOC109471158 [Branchiostoma belcheri]